VTERRRRSVRLSAHDYTSPGAYFVTVCAHGRRCIFEAPELRLLVEEAWNQTPRHFANAATDEFVIMPNHLHGILWIAGVSAGVGARHASPLQDSADAKGPRGAVAGSLGAIVGSFKAAVSKRINASRETPRSAVWQRNYYERIIRNEDELRRVREYIRLNPVQWDFDRENPNRILDVARTSEWGWLEGAGGPGRDQPGLVPTSVVEGER
jgi:putative transposase